MPSIMLIKQAKIKNCSQNKTDNVDMVINTTVSIWPQLRLSLALDTALQIS